MNKLTDFNTFANPRIVIILCLFALAGCTAGPWQREFWHPPAASGVAPLADGAKTYPIPRLGETKGEWPVLGDVPARPPRPEVDVAAQQQALASDKAEAETAAAAARTASSPEGAARPVVSALQPPTVPPEVVVE